MYIFWHPAQNLVQDFQSFGGTALLETQVKKIRVNDGGDGSKLLRVSSKLPRYDIADDCVYRVSA